MHNPRAVLTIGLVIAVVVGGCALTFGGTSPPHPGALEQVLVPAGTVLQVRGEPRRATFEVPPEGGVVVGVAEVDHTLLIVVVPGLGIQHCPAIRGFYGSAWNYSVNASLTPGEYSWGPVCGGFANITVTSPIEVIVP